MDSLLLDRPTLEGGPVKVERHCEVDLQEVDGRGELVSELKTKLKRLHLSPVSLEEELPG